MASIEFFFDFASPYAYLAHSQMPALAKKYNYELIYRPIDLIAAKKAVGNTGPATIQMPIKFRYIAKDLQRWADRYGIPFITQFDKMPPPAAGEGGKKPELPKGLIDSSRTHKGVFYAREQGKESEYVACVYQSTFGAGRMAGQPEVLEIVAQEMGWSLEDFLAYIDSDEANRIYEEANQDAQSRGVFGVPAMIVGEEMWWGNDRLGLLEEYLAAHPGN